MNEAHGSRIHLIKQPLNEDSWVTQVRLQRNSANPLTEYYTEHASPTDEVTSQLIFGSFSMKTTLLLHTPQL